MQTRPYDTRDGKRIWLSRAEQRRLLAHYDEGAPRRRIALELALHGLRSDEVNRVQWQHVRKLERDADRWALAIPAGKGDERAAPISTELYQQMRYFKNARSLRQDEPIVDVSTRSLRTWIQGAREQLANGPDDPWHHLGMHDLRRTWATDSYYGLAFAGVPIAEQLVMSWGGWAMTSKGRETFRRNYLGPVPDHITSQAIEHLPIARREQVRA